MRFFSTMEKDPVMRVVFGFSLLVFGVMWMRVSLVKSIWRDEAFSLLVSQEPLSEILSISIQDFNPPLYMFMLKFWTWLVGGGVISARALSLLGILLFIIFSYWWLEAYVSNLSGFNVLVLGMYIFFAVIQTNWLHFATEVRAYGWVFLIVIISLKLSLMTIQATTFRRHLYAGALLGLVLSLGMYLHYVVVLHSIVLLSAIGVYAFFKKSRFVLFGLVIAMGVALMLYIPWLNVLFSQARGASNSFWLSFSWDSVKDMLLGMYVFSEGVQRYPFAKKWMFGLLTLFVGWRIVGNYQKTSLGSYVLVILGGMNILAIIGVSWLFAPLTYGRYAAYILVFTLMFVFLELTTLGKTRTYQALLILGALVVPQMYGVANLMLDASPTQYALVEGIALDSTIYSDSDLDITSCMYYADCVYVGVLSESDRYVGVTQLTSLTSLSSWSDITDDRFFALHRHAQPHALEYYGYTATKHWRLGDGVELVQYIHTSSFN